MVHTCTPCRHLNDAVWENPFDSGSSHASQFWELLVQTRMMMQPTNAVSYFNEPREGIEPVQKSSTFPAYIQADTEMEEGSVVDGPHVHSMR
jgi:hypothetical protein